VTQSNGVGMQIYWHDSK